MPVKRPSVTSINQDKLAALRDQGEDSEVLLMRLALTESEGIRKTLAELANPGNFRVFPECLPTQASGRWSTKNPALVNFPREFWKEHKGIIHPDPGEWWLQWDWKGIEGRLFTAYSGDEEDLQWFQPGYDIHTLTCQKYLFEWPDGWLPPDWQGSNDERRIRAKNFRYGPYQYGSGSRAILGMPGIEILGLSRDVLVQRAQRFLAARPKGLAWKKKIWDQIQADRDARMAVHVRTFMGRRRMLVGDLESMQKDGLAHIISGSVADLMAWCLIEIAKQWPESSLILNKHDGAIVAFPYTERASERSSVCERTQEEVRALVEREWEVGQGVTMGFPATWEVIYGHE